MIEIHRWALHMVNILYTCNGSFNYSSIYFSKTQNQTLEEPSGCFYNIEAVICARPKWRTNDYTIEDSSESEDDDQGEDKIPTDGDGEFELGEDINLSLPFLHSILLDKWPVADPKMWQLSCVVFLTVSNTVNNQFNPNNHLPKLEPSTLVKSVLAFYNHAEKGEWKGIKKITKGLWVQ